MSNKHLWLFGSIAALLITGLFYYQTILFGKLPVPTDTLIGLYQPWRDLYLATNPSGVAYKNFLITDPIRQQIPWRKMVVDQWKAEQRVGWDPTSFGGSTLAYNFQAGTWYPLTVLFFFLPFTVGWTVLIMSQTFLLLWFTYLFLINKKLHPMAALFGAIAVSFGGFSIAWLTWGTIVAAFLWLPLILLSVDNLSKKPYLFILILALFCSLTAGHIQTTFYVLIFSGCYALRHRKSAIVFFLTGLLLAAISSPVLIRFIQTLSQTVRGGGGAAWQTEGFFVPFKHLIQFVIPDYFGNPATLNYFGTWNYGEMVGYVGVVGLLFAFFALKQKFEDKKFFGFAILISLLFATDNPISHLPYLWKIPVLSLLQPTRLMAVIGFCLAVFAAYGLDALLQKIISKKQIVIAVGLLFLMFGVSLIKANPISLRNAIFPLLILILASGIVMLRKQMVWVLVVLSLVDLMRFGWKFTPFTPPSYFFPITSILTEIQKDQLANPTRTLVMNPQAMPANTFSWYGIETVGGYNPFYSERYARFVSAMESGTVSNATVAFQRIIEPTNTKSPLLKYFNVRYVVDIQDNKTVLTELSSVMPRWYLADTMVVKSTDQELLQTMLTDTAASRSAYVETAVDARFSSTDTVSLQHYSANTQSLSTTIQQSGFLVNLTPWDAGWHAYIDGKEVPILRTNYLFMGISVPAGTHTVEFRYR